jgi:hypothetical protein
MQAEFQASLFLLWLCLKCAPDSNSSSPAILNAAAANGRRPPIVQGLRAKQGTFQEWLAQLTN